MGGPLLVAGEEQARSESGKVPDVPNIIHSLIVKESLEMQLRNSMFAPGILLQIFPPNPAYFRLTEQKEVSHTGSALCLSAGSQRVRVHTDRRPHVSSETSVPGATLTDAPCVLFLLRDADETVWLTGDAVLGLKAHCATMKVANLLLAGQKKEPAPLQTWRIQQLGG